MSPVEDTRYTDSKRRSWLEDARRDSERAGRWAYYTPLLILIGAYFIAAAIVASTFESGGLFGALVGSAVTTAVFLVISVPIGVLAMIVTCQIFKSEAGPLTLVLVRLAAVYSVMLVIALLMPGCFAILVSGLIMAGMVAILFDMELAEGAVFTIVSMAIFIGVNILLNMYLQNAAA